MLRALKNEGIRSRVLCLTKGEAFEEEIRNLGFEVDWVGPSQNKFARLGKIISNLRRRPVDVIQSVHFFTNIYAALAGRVLGTGSIGAIRSDLINEFSSNGFYSRWQLNLPQKLIANSQIAVERSVDKGIDPGNISLVRNVVEEGSNRLPSKDQKKMRLLFAGRLVPEKRPELFIHLASKLRECLPDMKLNFTIAGDGPLRLSIEQLSDELGFDRREMGFLGETSDMSQVYRKSDMLVLTSGHEGTPNVVLEAMAYGLPVVATRVGGVPEIVSNDCGILVDPSSLEELLDSTVKLIRNSDLRTDMGRNGQEYVGKNHSIGYLQKQLTDIYSQLLKNKN